MNTALAIFIGGGLGSLARFGIGNLSTNYFAQDFPFGTLLSNIFSCLILGVFLEWLSLKPNDAHPYRYLVVIGFCGGFSTFSSFSAETMDLIRQSSYFYASLNITGNIIGCMLTIALGSWLVRSIAN